MFLERGSFSLGFQHIKSSGSNLTKKRRKHFSSEDYFYIPGDGSLVKGLTSLPILHTASLPQFAVPKSAELLDIFRNVPIAPGFSAAGALYGGLHALAWNAYFNSFTEKLLWRLSACVVRGGFPTFLLLLVFVKNFKICWVDWLQWVISVLVGITRYTLFAVVPVAYPLARAYLVTECFLNIPHLPAGVYEVPTWSSYFSHVS